MANRYIVMSPDGFPISRDAEYKSKKEAEEATLAFVERYRKQGYYSQTTSKIVHIPVDEIKDHCRLVKL